MQLIKDIIPNVIKNLAPADIQDQLLVERIWKTVVGAEAAKAVFAGCKEGVLFIKVDSQARLFMMRMRKQNYLSQLQKQCPQINNIVFKIGKVT